MTPARVFWRQTPETGAKVEIIKKKKDIYLFIHILPLLVTYIYGKVSSVYCHFIDLAQNKLNSYVQITSTQKFDFKCHHGQRCRWLLGTKHCAEGACCDVINYVTCT